MLTVKWYNSIDKVTAIWYNMDTARETEHSRTASDRKEKSMNELTNEQFKAFIQLILQIIRDNDDKEEAIKKIEALIKNN